MENDTRRLKDWALNKIKEEYADDVALLVAVSGHSINNDGHGECFDYFIPATERGYELSQTFIVAGIGYDLYPRSWERTEATASLDDGPTLCLENAEIIYSRSKEDEERFNSIRKKLYSNLANKHFMIQKGLEQLDVAMNLYSSLIFQDKMYQVRMAVGYISKYLAKTIAYLNHTSLDIYVKEKIDSMQEAPKKFIAYNEAILQATTTVELNKLAFSMIDEVRKFVEAHKKDNVQKNENPDYSNLAGWYHELSLTFRRMRYYCDMGNNEGVFIESCHLQNELGIVQEEFGLKEMDLLGYYNPEILEDIKEQANLLEQYIIYEIERHGEQKQERRYFMNKEMRKSVIGIFI